MPRYRATPNGKVQFTAEEEAERDLEEQAWADGAKDRKLTEIKRIRLIKLKETDYLALSDTTLSEAMSGYRQGLRDIPQTYTTEEQYDLLLAREDKILTHEIWSKPE